MSKEKHPYVGRYVISRGERSGVHVGVLTAASGSTVFLKEARRLYEWHGAFTLNGVALYGVKKATMPDPLPEIYISDSCEIIPTSEISERCLRNIQTHKT